MKIVISPAKSLDFESTLPIQENTEAIFLGEAEKINKQLRKKSAKSLSKLMGISDALGQLNYERNLKWKTPFTPKNARPSVYAFNGDVYRGLAAYSIPLEKIAFMQSSLRIISGLYGLLRPLDLIQAYRLEMGTKIPVGKCKNLYEFWKSKITQQLNAELIDNEVFINLASNEYFKAIDQKKLKTAVITPVFMQFKNDEYKNIAIFSKYARGLMARYIIDTQAKSVDDLKDFNYDNYRFSETLSSNSKLVFTR